MENLSFCEMEVSLSDVMTRNPRTIEIGQDLSIARKWMDELQIRHLPVRQNGKLVGIISDRDLNLVLGLGDKDGRRIERHENLIVEDAMMSGVVELLESTRLSKASQIMLERKIGSVLVKDDHGNLTGIFTEFDALKVLAGQA